MDYHQRYESINALADAAAPAIESGKYLGGAGISKNFSGVSTWKEAAALAIDGWAGEAAKAEEVALAAVESIEAEYDMPAFRSYYDVTGSDVDVARFLSGEPECMIGYEMVQTPRAGRVITLCASVSVSGSIKADTITRRGYGIAALAFALERIGFATELWADLSAQGGKDSAHVRVLVKGPSDELDAARVMFAYAHPAMLRVLALGAMHTLPKAAHNSLGVGFSYGSPMDPKRDLPDGTIYLPSISSAYDVPDADVALRQHMKDLGIIG